MVDARSPNRRLQVPDRKPRYEQAGNRDRRDRNMEGGLISESDCLAASGNPCGQWGMRWRHEITNLRFAVYFVLHRISQHCVRQPDRHPHHWQVR